MLTQKNLIFIGAPGAGKGTISSMMLGKYPVAHISTGDLLRGEIKNNTELGKQAAVLMEQGKLVPDEMVAGMVESKLNSGECENGFILDGFPRTVNQAALLDRAMARLNQKLDKVIYFKVCDDILLQRLTARQNCRKCGAIYNKLFMPSRRGNACEICGGELFQRPDDSPETAKSRLEVFYKQTQPLIDFYRDKGILWEITEADKNKIFAMLSEQLEQAVS